MQAACKYIRPVKPQKYVYASVALVLLITLRGHMTSGKTDFLKGKLQPIIIDEKSLSELNITRITFEQLVDYCQFDRL